MSANPGRNAGKSAYQSISFPFRVEEWSDDGVHLYECHAGASYFDAALAAYRAMVRELPHRYITLRDGARVIEKHEPKKKKPHPADAGRG